MNNLYSFNGGNTYPTQYIQNHNLFIEYKPEEQKEYFLFRLSDPGSVSFRITKVTDGFELECVDTFDEDYECIGIFYELRFVIAVLAFEYGYSFENCKKLEKEFDSKGWK